MTASTRADQTAPPEAQPRGTPVANWRPRPRPPWVAMAGRYTRVEPLDPSRHGDDLAVAFAEDRAGKLCGDRIWTYSASGPFGTEADFRAWLAKVAAMTDPLYFALIDDTSGAAGGLASYMRINPAHGAIEVGAIVFAPVLQRSRVATEAMYLMMRRAFDDLGYRRYEWKCDALNAASRRAALRLGFTFEGIFRQDMVNKGRNRDTAWFSILDTEWPRLKAAFEAWLVPENFDADGGQKKRLSHFAG